MTLEEISKINGLNLSDYWKKHGRSEKDFHCKECGKFMLDVDDIREIRYVEKAKRWNNSFYDTSRKRIYVESETNRWFVVGRNLSGKVFFRHLCWDCFFKKLPEIEDIPKRARKSSWYKDILSGNLRPPASCSSPSRYFKLLFDITDEELEKEHKKFDTASLESFMRRHGEKNGRIKYEEYKARQAYTCSMEYMVNEKGMTESQWKEYNRRRACTKENFMRRYGEELGSEKWDQYCEVEAYAGKKIEYFIWKYGEEEGRRKYLEVNRKKALTLENFIRKYGEEEGKARFSKLGNSMYSMTSQKMFDMIQEKLGPYGNGAKYGMFEESIELRFDDGRCRTCYPDYILGNKIIEFNGDYWHMNPNFYGPESPIPFVSGINSQNKFEGNTAKCIWKYDREKCEKLRELGYDVKVVWEFDYNKDKERTIDECVDFLRGHNG